jgi:glycosyltransferase involved in cell wall biosynthesis
MDNQPLVTIVLTTYNRAHLIEETLDTIINQTYKKWECIIIDDNSIDTTNIIVNNVIENDQRFQFYIKPKEIPQGLPSSRNIGIKKAKGEFLVFFDDDDVVHPQLLEICVSEFKKNQNLDFVHYQKKSFQDDFLYSNIKYIDSCITDILTENIYENVIIGELPIASCTVLWNSELLKNNLFNEVLMYAEEWECYSRILLTKDNILGLKINVPLYYNRKHKVSNTGEFWSDNPMRLDSYKLAHQLICELLITNDKMTTKLAQYFIQKAYELKDNNITKVFLFSSLKFKFYSIIFPIKYNLYKLLK